MPMAICVLPMPAFQVLFALPYRPLHLASPPWCPLPPSAPHIGPKSVPIGSATFLNPQPPSPALCNKEHLFASDPLKKGRGGENTHAMPRHVVPHRQTFCLPRVLFINLYN